jgi:hypothetical protein
VKSKEMKTGLILEELSKEGYDSKSTILPMMITSGDDDDSTI